jgi:SAM-dependent methyltransferase
MNIKSKTIDRCQISNKKDLKRILSLGFLPPVNDYQLIGSRKKEEVFFPAELMISKSSGLAQLSTIVKKEIIFPKEYPYTSSTTKILRENFKDLYIECSKLLKMKQNDLIVDIGSNDGNLLSNFQNKHRVLGVTPELIGKIAIKRGIKTLIRYFDNVAANLILKKYGKAKLITATNVFAHIDNIENVMKNIEKILDKNGVFVSESHYLVDLIKTVQYDTIYHEHMRYYSLTSLSYLFKKFNYKIFHAKKIPTHGGSIRVYVTKNKNQKIYKSVSKILKYEKNYLSEKTFKEFKHNVIMSKMNLYSLLKKLKSKKKLIYGVGAPSRAATLVNYVGLNEDIIDYILEINGSYKIGKYMPGTNIPILNEKIINKKKPDYLLILSWHISNSLIKIFRKKGFKGKFIIPLPEPKIVK